MSLRKRTTPGEIVAAIIVFAGAAGLIWAALNDYVPEVIAFLPRKAAGLAGVAVLVGGAVVAGYAVNRILGIEPPE